MRRFLSDPTFLFSIWCALCGGSIYSFPTWRGDISNRCQNWGMTDISFLYSAGLFGVSGLGLLMGYLYSNRGPRICMYYSCFMLTSGLLLILYGMRLVDGGKGMINESEQVSPTRLSTRLLRPTSSLTSSSSVSKKWSRPDKYESDGVYFDGVGNLELQQHDGRGNSTLASTVNVTVASTVNSTLASTVNSIVSDLEAFGETSISNGSPTEVCVSASVAAFGFVVFFQGCCALYQTALFCQLQRCRPRDTGQCSGLITMGNGGSALLWSVVYSALGKVMSNPFIPYLILTGVLWASTAFVAGIYVFRNETPSMMFSSTDSPRSDGSKQVSPPCSPSGDNSVLRGENTVLRQAVTGSSKDLRGMTAYSGSKHSIAKDGRNGRVDSPSNHARISEISVIQTDRYDEDDDENLVSGLVDPFSGIANPMSSASTGSNIPAMATPTITVVKDAGSHRSVGFGIGTNVPVVSGLRNIRSDADLRSMSGQYASNIGISDHYGMSGPYGIPRQYENNVSNMGNMERIASASGQGSPLGTPQLGSSPGATPPQITPPSGSTPLSGAAPGVTTAPKVTELTAGAASSAGRVQGGVSPSGGVLGGAPSYANQSLHGPNQSLRGPPQSIHSSSGIAQNSNGLFVSSEGSSMQAQISQAQMSQAQMSQAQLSVTRSNSTPAIGTFSRDKFTPLLLEDETELRRVRSNAGGQPPESPSGRIRRSFMETVRLYTPRASNEPLPPIDREIVRFPRTQDMLMSSCFWSVVAQFAFVQAVASGYFLANTQLFEKAFSWEQSVVSGITEIQSLVNTGSRLIMGFALDAAWKSEWRVERSRFLMLTTIFVMTALVFMGPMLNLKHPYAPYIAYAFLGIGFGGNWACLPAVISSWYGKERVAAGFNVACLTFVLTSFGLQSFIQYLVKSVDEMEHDGMMLNPSDYGPNAMVSATLNGKLGGKLPSYDVITGNGVIVSFEADGYPIMAGGTGFMPIVDGDTAIAMHYMNKLLTTSAITSVSHLDTICTCICFLALCVGIRLIFLRPCRTEG